MSKNFDEVKPIKDETAPASLSLPSLSMLATSRNISGTRKDYFGGDSVVENVSQEDIELNSGEKRKWNARKSLN